MPPTVGAAMMPPTTRMMTPTSFTPSAIRPIPAIKHTAQIPVTTHLMMVGLPECTSPQPAPT
jgi:hypothetical protein